MEPYLFVEEASFRALLSSQTTPNQSHMIRDNNAMRNTSEIPDASDIGIVSQNCAQSSGLTEHESFYKGTSYMRPRDTFTMNENSLSRDENSSLSQECITLSSSTESEAVYNDANRMLYNSLMADTTALRDAEVIQNICLPGTNARFSEICTEHPSEMHCANLSFPNLNNSFSLTNKGDEIDPERKREEAKIPWMNLPATKVYKI